MKALSYSTFGGIETMSLRDLPVPRVGPLAVLIRVMAVSLNPVDVQMREGLDREYLTPRFPAVPGLDVVGEIVRLGADTPRFAIGDRVLAHALKDVPGDGTLAEFVEVPARSVTHLPAGLDVERAATLPLAAQTALQALRRANVSSGARVLVHAASGGVGQFAIQLAARQGARVVGTASPRNHDFVRDRGAEPVDYRGDLVTRLGAEKFDAILDFGGDLDLTASLLAPGGTVASIVDPRARDTFGGEFVWLDSNAADLAEVAQQAAAGQLRTDVGGVYPLDEWRAAFDAFENRRVRGKIVIRLL